MSFFAFVTNKSATVGAKLCRVTAPIAATFKPFVFYKSLVPESKNITVLLICEPSFYSAYLNICMNRCCT